MNQLWGRIKKAHKISLEAEFLAGILLQKRPPSTKKIFTPECISPEWEKANLSVDVTINKESILNWHWKVDTAQFYTIKFLKPV